MEANEKKEKVHNKSPKSFYFYIIFAEFISFSFHVASRVFMAIC